MHNQLSNELARLVRGLQSTTAWALFSIPLGALLGITFYRTTGVGYAWAPATFSAASAVLSAGYLASRS